MNIQKSAASRIGGAVFSILLLPQALLAETEVVASHESELVQVVPPVGPASRDVAPPISVLNSGIVEGSPVRKSASYSEPSTESADIASGQPAIKMQSHSSGSAAGLPEGVVPPAGLISSEPRGLTDDTSLATGFSR